MTETTPRRFELPTPQALAGASEAMGRWAHRTFTWWPRRAPGNGRLEAPAAPALLPAPVDARPVLLDVAGPIATVTINRPERRNALNLAVWQALRETATRLMG